MMTPAGEPRPPERVLSRAGFLDQAHTERLPASRAPGDVEMVRTHYDIVQRYRSLGSDLRVNGVRLLRFQR